MDENREAEIQGLRDEISRLLAVALRSEIDHTAAVEVLKEVHALDVADFVRALDLDLIGQAKGVVMATLGCSADDAFALMVKQSQHENRKVHHLAANIVSRKRHHQDRGHQRDE